MKRITLPLLFLLGLATSCSQQQSVAQNAVKETYLHQYGVTVTQAEWEAGGRTGTVISALPDGVTLSQSYRGGILDGETTYSFPHSSTIEHTITYQEGNIIREVWNYPSGMPRHENRQEGAKNHVVTTWYESGIPKSVEEYEGTKLVNGAYHDQSNQTEARISAGEGTRISRDQWGQLISNDEFCAGELKTVTTFHSNGAPKEVISYQEGKVEGIKRTFNPSGEPMTVEEWHNNLQDGITTTYRNGYRVSEIPYVAGKQHGIEKRYNTNDEIVEEISWTNGSKHGLTTIYVEGKKQKDYYHRGKLVSQAVFDELNSHVRQQHVR